MIALVLAALLGASAPPGRPPPPRTLALAGVGAVQVRVPEGRPRRAVLLLSGEGGMSGESLALADALAVRGALVLAIDTAGYLARHRDGRCVYPAGALE